MIKETLSTSQISASAPNLTSDFRSGGLPGARPFRGVVVAVEFIRKMKENSRTSLVRADDGQFYVAKLPRGLYPGRILANELFATRLATFLGLPARHGVVVTLPPRLIPENDEPRLDGATNSNSPSMITRFASSYPGPPGENLVVDFLPQRLLNQVPNLRDAFWGFLLFDLWTGNAGPRQALFSRLAMGRGAKYSAWVINHSRCFGGERWGFADDLPLAYYWERIVYSQVGGLEFFQPYLSRIESIQLRQIEECAHGIPDDWLAGGPERFHSLIETLHERRTWIRQGLAEKIEAEKRTFPNWA
jgi:hypothetical protein